MKSILMVFIISWWKLYWNLYWWYLLCLDGNYIEIFIEGIISWWKLYYCWRYYILMANFLVMALVPFTLLVGLNFKLYRTVQVCLTLRILCDCECQLTMTVVIGSAPTTGIWSPEWEKEASSWEKRTEDRISPHPPCYCLWMLQRGQDMSQLYFPLISFLLQFPTKVKIIINLYEVFLVAVYGNYKKWPLW